jgi:uncharacterized protein with PQ loop repeat
MGGHMQFLYRLVIAVVVALMLFALLPHVLNIFKINSSGDLSAIFTIVIGFGALIYVIKGPDLPPFRS